MDAAAAGGTQMPDAKSLFQKRKVLISEGACSLQQLRSATNLAEHQITLYPVTRAVLHACVANLCVMLCVMG